MREQSGARHADVVEADALQLARVGHRVVGPEPALGPVVRADARAERALLRPGFAHGGRDLEGKLASVGPIGVFSLVRKRRQELVQEIAVRRMQLEHVEADAPGAQRGADEILHQNFNFVDFKFTRNMPALRHGDRRRRDRLPRRLRRGERLAPFPRHLRGALAPGMSDLDAYGSISKPFTDLDHPRHCRFVVVVVEAAAAVGDASFARDMGRLHHQQPGAGIGEMAEVDEMPVVHAAVVGRVLAHRRDDDAVGQRDAAELDGSEELRERQSRFLFPKRPA